MSFIITHQDIHLLNLKSDMQNFACGGFVAFEGWVRNENEGHRVEKLEYQAYEPLAIKEADLILKEAEDKFGKLTVKGAHRVGLLELGELAVWIGVATPHRDEAFSACRMIIDEIKIRLPIWKKEYYTDKEPEWVNCQRCSNTKHHHSH